MAGMARGAAADGAVRVGTSDAMALLAAAGHRGSTFELNEGMRRAASASGLVRL